MACPCLHQFHFGAERELFGVYAEPEVSVGARNAILLCNGVGKAYQAHHNLAVHLLSRLAAGGYPCLLFDYPGHGDSLARVSGDPETQWPELIASALVAAAELGNLAAPRTIKSLGLANGAWVAAETAVHASAQAVVLYDPPLNGGDLDAVTEGHANSAVDWWQVLERRLTRIAMTQEPEASHGNEQVIGSVSGPDAQVEIEAFEEAHSGKLMGRLPPIEGAPAAFCLSATLARLRARGVAGYPCNRGEDGINVDYGCVPALLKALADGDGVRV